MTIRLWYDFATIWARRRRLTGAGTANRTERRKKSNRGLFYTKISRFLRRKELKIQWVKNHIGGRRKPSPIIECRRHCLRIHDTKTYPLMPPYFMGCCLIAPVCPAEMRPIFPMKAGASSSTTHWMKFAPPLDAVTIRQHGYLWNWKSAACLSANDKARVSLTAFMCKSSAQITENPHTPTLKSRIPDCGYIAGNNKYFIKLSSNSLLPEKEDI